MTVSTVQTPKSASDVTASPTFNSDGATSIGKPRSWCSGERGHCMVVC